MEGSRDSAMDDSRVQSLRALVAYEETKTSLRSILREFETASDSRIERRGALALEVMRYLNTIDFLLIRGLGKRNLSELDVSNRNLARMALCDLRWLRLNIDEIDQKYPNMPSFLKQAVIRACSLDLNGLTARMPLSSRYSLEYSHPSFLVKALLDNLPENEVQQLLQSNNRSRSYYIRANHLLGGNVEVLTSLAHNGVVLRTVEKFPGLYEVRDGIENLIASSEFQKGTVLIQDLSSVLAVHALDVQPHDFVWDACAAPGMKTQLLCELLGGTGRIVATDYYESRIEEARKLSMKLGMTAVDWKQSDATKPEITAADKILIDAPCTSTGILQTYPSFKWKLNKNTLFALMAVQNKILDGILTAYENSPGTELVYATCSVLPHEGESQIDSALSRHNVELLTPVLSGSPGYSGFECSSMVTRLFPHRHASNGFFIARLRIGR